MHKNLTTSLTKGNIIAFVWQHILLFLSLFIMTFGVALCVRSSLGSSVISTIPYVMTLAGDVGVIPTFTIGEWTYIMNFLLVGLQIIVLRRQFEYMQLFQLVIGFLFGWLLDINMLLASAIPERGILMQIIMQVAGCTVLALGIALEVRCGSVTMPGEGLPIAISKITGMPFAKVKIIVDISLVMIAVILGYIYLGCWQWKVVGGGTLFAMIYVGWLVKMVNPHLAWFDRIVCYRPGLHRYVYGLLRRIRN